MPKPSIWLKQRSANSRGYLLRDHAGDELLAEAVDGADVAEGRHGATQLVGPLGREPCPDDGDPHRLLLEERHAERLVEHFLQLFGRIGDLLLAALPAEVGMHHVALDRAGADDRDLDDQVVELFRAQPRQHVHLRPALHLEHADAVGAAEHGVGLGVVLRHRLQGQRPAAVLGDQREGAADAGEHPEAQHVDLQDAQRLDVVLVPFDGVAVLHRRLGDDGELRQRAAGDDEAADMGGEVAGEAGQLLGQLAGHAEARAGGRVEAPFGRHLGERRSLGAPDRLGQPRGHVLRESHRLAHLADRAAVAVADHGGGDGGAVAAVAAVDVLDHLLAPLVLEIHVDVGRLVARRRR